MLFAQTVVKDVQDGDLIWVHDYHLMLVPRLLRARHPHARVGFFLHTPFPGADALAALPPAQRGALLDGLLGADVVGFHTEEDAERFRDAARTVLGRPVRGGAVMVGGRGVHVGAFPMGIDATAFAARALAGVQRIARPPCSAGWPSSRSPMRLARPPARRSLSLSPGCAGARPRGRADCCDPRAT